MYMLISVGGQGQETGIKEVGSLRKAGEEEGSGILKVAGTGRNRNFFCNIV